MSSLADEVCRLSALCAKLEKELSEAKLEYEGVRHKFEFEERAATAVEKRYYLLPKDAKSAKPGDHVGGVPVQQGYSRSRKGKRALIVISSAWLHHHHHHS